jgi:hypothetical protein
MTILHSGASRKFADNWQKIFGVARPVKKSAGKKTSAKPSRGKASKKSAKAAPRARMAKKKPSAKKAGRR